MSHHTVVNIRTNKVARLIGKSETHRFLNMALYQGAPKKKGVYTLVSLGIAYDPCMYIDIFVGNGCFRQRNAQRKWNVGSYTILHSIQTQPILHVYKARALWVSTMSKIHQWNEKLTSSLHRDESQKGDRDVFNEKPSREEQTVAATQERKQVLGTHAIIRTTRGDIHIRLFPDVAPKAVENFVTHSKNGYYDNLIFHRVIKGFMIQTGCPFGMWMMN